MSFLDVEDLIVYQKLCDLHLEISTLTKTWPKEETYELGSQIRRSSNSSPSQLAEKNDDRHIRNKIEGINISRGEANETIHHLFIAYKKNYITEEVYYALKAKYKECIRRLNGLERTLEQKLPKKDQRWNLDEQKAPFDSDKERLSEGWPKTDT